MIESILHMKQSLLAELVAEFLGTMVLILFGTGVVAMVVLFGHGLPGEIVNGGFTTITPPRGVPGVLRNLIRRQHHRPPPPPPGALKHTAHTPLPLRHQTPPSTLHNSPIPP